MIDSLLSLRPRFETAGAKIRYGLDRTPFAFVTLHRPSNVDDRSTLTGICTALERIQQSIKLFWPLHPRTRNRLTEHDLLNMLKQMKNVIISEPLSYIDSMSIMSSASMVLTDSGGIQEETTVLGIPCLTLRNNTERPVTISEGTNELVGNNPELIYKRAMEILRTGGKTGKTPKLWDGKAAERIVNIILAHVHSAEK